MIIIVFLLLLVFSFTLHIYFLIKYVVEKSNRFLKRFINTAVSNILIAGMLTVTTIYRPSLVNQVNITLLMWVISGFVMCLMLYLKVSILKSIYRRCQDPQHYHFNYFGKKVLHGTVVSKPELMIFFFTIPVFLATGGYFIARLVNYILFGTL